MVVLMNKREEMIIQRCITKDAHLLSSQARKSVAYDYPIAALFDSVSGYCELDDKCMTMVLPNEGLECALESMHV